MEPGWHKTADVDPPNIEPFNHTTGPATLLPPGTEPIRFFEQVFGVDFSASVAEATNLNAVAKAPPRGYGPHRQFDTGDPLWHPTTADEVKAYIGINIAMGIKNLPGYKDYWSTEPLLHDAFISGILTRTRYEKLCQYLHCSVPVNEDRNGKLAKVRPLITLWAVLPAVSRCVDRRGDGAVRWSSVLEAVHAKEASEVGDQALVPLRFYHWVLCCLQCVLRPGRRPRRFLRPRLNGSDARPFAASPPCIR